MIRVKIKIGENGQVQDSTYYGLVYLSSDNRVGAESKDFEMTSYPEEEGEHILPKTADAPFDYKVKFFIQATSLNNANAIIANFNSSLYDILDESKKFKQYKEVTFYNPYKRHKIVGYPHPIAEATDFWRDPKNQVHDVVTVEWTIRVPKPSKCDWNYVEGPIGPTIEP